MRFEEFCREVGVNPLRDYPEARALYDMWQESLPVIEDEETTGGAALGCLLVVLALILPVIWFTFS